MYKNEVTNAVPSGSKIMSERERERGRARIDDRDDIQSSRGVVVGQCRGGNGGDRERSVWIRVKAALAFVWE
mgnify:CR=1 FL=1